MKAVRIQLQRTKGFDLQAASREVNGLECVNVARPTRFGNPYSVQEYGLALSLTLYGNTIRGIWSPEPIKHHPDELWDSAFKAHHAFLSRMGDHPIQVVRAELKGKNVACFCALSDRCHGDYLLSLSGGDAQ